MQPSERIVVREEEKPAAPVAPEAQRTVVAESVFVPLDDTGMSLPQVPDVTVSLAPSTPRRHRALLAGFAAVGGVALLQWLLTLAEQLRESPVMGTLWLGATLMLLVPATAAGLREWRRLRRMRVQRDVRAQADAMFAREGIGAAQALCESIAQAAGHTETAGYGAWRRQLVDTHNDREVLALFDHHVLAPCDQRALQAVVKRSGDTAVAVAISQFAAVDMLLVFWRSLRMLEEITAAYGIETGYWDRIRLLRVVLRNMALAGASELVAEAGMQMLGTELAGKFSTSVAQGLGVGVLTARLGLRAMDSCRPLPWCGQDKPTLAAVRGGLLSYVRSALERA